MTSFTIKMYMHLFSSILYQVLTTALDILSFELLRRTHYVFCDIFCPVVFHYTDRLYSNSIHSKCYSHSSIPVRYDNCPSSNMPRMSVHGHLFLRCSQLFSQQYMSTLFDVSNQIQNSVNTPSSSLLSSTNLSQC